MALGSTITQITDSGLKPGITFPSFNATGIATASNFKTGTTDVHSTGVTAATSVVGSAVTSNSTGVIVTGVTTSNSFVGTLTGNVTGNVTGTVTQLETNATGANLTLTGNLGVGGTITYEDVARVDATGISTFREGFGVGPLAGIALTAYKDGSIRTSGIVTASTYYGSGANLTGIDLGAVTGATGDFSIADKIIHTGDTNTAIRFPSADTITAETGGTERLRITSDGRLLAGTATSKSAGSGQYAKLNIEGGTGTTENFVSFSRAEAASAMSANDEVANLTFNDSAGYEFARIQVLADAATGATDTPGRIVFKTTADGASSATERLRIDSSGKVSIGTVQTSHTLGVTGGSSSQLLVKGGEADIWLTSTGSGSAKTWRILGSTGGSTHRFRIYDGANSREPLFIDNDGISNFDRGAPSSANKVITRHQCESSRRLDIVWHDSGSLMGFDTPSNHGYIFKCNGTERMRIHASGAVNKNHQPCFQAHSNGASSVDIPSNTGSDYIFTTESFDNSSSYNTSNGRFTAPVAGKYLFGIQLYAGFSITGVRVLHAKFSKNGGDDYATDIMGGTNNSGGTSWHPTATGTVMYELAANDYVTWNIGSFAGSGSGNATIYGAKGTRFWGYLVA